MGRNLPKTMASPRAVLYQSVLTLIPANADPLLLVAEVNAYKTSDSPCGPVFSIAGAFARQRHRDRGRRSARSPA